MSPTHFPLPTWAKFSLAAVAALLLAGLGLSWNQPLLDQHGFRQTQTAISAYWMTRGSPLWLYETPLFGPPWTVPFEFPLYQWLVAGLAGSGLSITLDQSARLVSLAALLGCIWPLRVSLRLLGATPEMAATAVILFLSSPVHAFWGRAAMIETLALLLAMCFLAVIQLLVARRQWWYFAAATLLATAAIVVKVATFFTFAVLAGAVVAIALASDLRSRRYRQALCLAGAAALPMVFAFLSLLAWLDASDSAKASSPLTSRLTSDQLSRWNYGTFAQRISSEFWVDTVWTRIIPDVIGYAAPVLLGLAFLSKDRRGMLPWLLVAPALFLLPMLVFTNVHKIHNYHHNYYQVANAVFLVVFLAVLVEFASRGRAPWLAATLTLACTVAMVSHSYFHFLPTVSQDRAKDSNIKLARVIRANVARDDVIIIARLDWSAAVPYYAQRRAVMLTRWGSSNLDDLPKLRPTREQPQGANVGALVQCGQGCGFLEQLADRLGPASIRVKVGRCVVSLRR